MLPQTGLISHEYTMFLYELLLTEPSAMIDVYNDMVVSVSEVQTKTWTALGGSPSIPAKTGCDRSRSTSATAGPRRRRFVS